MGDPRKARKTYKGPSHPWEAGRIAEEKVLIKDYGLKNKKEIWKVDSELRRLKAQAKKLIRDREKGLKQRDVEEKQLLGRLFKLGLLDEGTKLEDVLELSVKDLLERRLQTLVSKVGLSLGLKQSRQFIVHGHVFVGGRKVTVPSYLVSRNEQMEITFRDTSSLASEEHPERVKRIQLKEVKEEVKEEVKDGEKPAVEPTEEELKKIEKEVGDVVAKT